MQSVLQQISSYWQEGGVVMLPLAVGCLVMMFYLMRARRHVHFLLRSVAEVGDAGDERSRQIRGDLMVVAALTAAAPLLGLLGTVAGMITTFDAVRGAGSTIGGQLSAGISQALITTQAGLVVAIPGLFGVARIQRLLDQVAIVQHLSKHTGNR